MGSQADGHSFPSPVASGRKAKEIINAARENLAKMIGARPRDMIFTSGGTESNNLVIHSVVKHFHKIHAAVGDTAEHPSPVEGALPHIITCTVEHDSIRLPLEHLVEERVAEVTFVPVSKVNGQAEAEDILAAVRPATCLVTIMLANNETGVIMPVPEISRRVRALNQQRAAGGLPGVLVHTDAAQALGKRRVDMRDLGVDFLTIVGHKFYGPRIGALYIRGLGELTPLYPMLFGGGQERNFRPGTENTPMIAGLGKAAELVAENCEAYEAHMRDVRDYLEERLAAEFGKRIHLNSQFPGTERLPNTCNFSILGPQLQAKGQRKRFLWDLLWFLSPAVRGTCALGFRQVVRGREPSNLQQGREAAPAWTPPQGPCALSPRPPGAGPVQDAAGQHGGCVPLGPRRPAIPGAAELRRPLGRGQERHPAQRGPRHHPGRSGPRRAGPEAGGGPAGGPGLVPRVVPEGVFLLSQSVWAPGSLPSLGQ
ncbi:selenocysteine lyase isoform X3 [Balaenoptera ricei]|uniref:selenocysteine lyase isoform X3 n=1 Tax=Balaenoptera ricei TaxID=2746895 RepID=UPI0028BE4B23|nr:selenocysteine lyase isoform X3 [Balaenoptera ricei]